MILKSFEFFLFVRLTLFSFNFFLVFCLILLDLFNFSFGVLVIVFAIVDTALRTFSLQPLLFSCILTTSIYCSRHYYFLFSFCFPISIG